MTQINIKHIANLNNDCLRGLEFYKQELGILQERLDEIAAANTGKEVMEQVEHFQNQFIIHKNAIEEIAHDVNCNNESIEKQLLKTEVFVSVETATAHQNIHEQYQTEEKIFNELRHEFNRFAAKWL
jgi:hypothetical protein